ncbi:MAG: fumarylacetoacetate hydrolase family protein [Bowdeniella nasicola]|nr:fumarylacetoacetate hydrolase family protein [Bowdeniella nasicola]
MGIHDDVAGSAGADHVGSDNTKASADRAGLLQQAADGLLGVYTSQEPVAPVRDTVPGLTLTEAYRIQQLQEEAFTRQGKTVVGRKVGLTSVAMQRQLGVDSPDFGFFTADVFYGDQARIPVAELNAPKVEPEFAFRLGRDLSGDVTVEEAAAAIESVHAAIEIIDSRIRDWDITLVDTVADNASCAAVAVNETPLEIALDSLVSAECALVIDGEKVGQGVGSDVMGDPVAPLAWLAKTLGEQGVTLRAGDWILPGSFCAAQPVVAGSQATADFGELGSVTITFVGPDEGGGNTDG